MLAARKLPRQQRSRETVAVILEAAAQVFARHGYPATTTNRIAERAGVSIGSLYQYFPDKQAVLVALADQHLTSATELVVAQLADPAGRSCSLAELLHELVTSVAAAHTGQPSLHRLLFDQAPRVPELVRRFRRSERRLAEALAGQLRRLGAGGADPELAGWLAVQGITAQLHGVILEPPDGRDRQECLTQLVALWTRALK